MRSPHSKITRIDKQILERKQQSGVYISKRCEYVTETFCNSCTMRVGQFHVGNEQKIDKFVAFHTRSKSKTVRQKTKAL